MSESVKVVAHLVGGKILKGTTQDFLPNRPVFHLHPLNGSPGIELRYSALKALFFVKDLRGNGRRRDLRGFLGAPGETTQGKKIAVRFKDGEMLCGYSLAYSGGREGFFLFPADRGSNNLRIFVVAAATRDVKAGVEAEALAREMLTLVRR